MSKVALILSWLLIASLLVACPTTPITPPTYTILEGMLTDWTGGVRALSGKLWPNEQAVANGQINLDGSFQLDLPDNIALSQLHNSFQEAVAGYTCTQVQSVPAALNLAALYFLNLPNGMVVAASGQAFTQGNYAVGDYGVLWFYSASDATITATCSSGTKLKFDYQLQLTKGWNAIKQEVILAESDQVQLKLSQLQNATYSWYLLGQ